MFFFSSRIREKGVFFSNLGASMDIRFGRKGGWGGSYQINQLEAAGNVITLLIALSGVSSLSVHLSLLQ